MSDSESVVAVAYWRDPDGNQHSRELSYGETFETECSDVEYVVFEVRLAEDDDLETDGGETPDHYWVECRRCGHGTLAFERHCLHCGLDRHEHRDPERRADGGTEGIDKSQTVREAAQPAVTTLQVCRRSDHCHRLAEVVTRAAPVDSLDYEDLFYPMRCHRDDGLVLRVEGDARQSWIEYGPGDLFFWMGEGDRSLENAVEPNNLWEALQAGMIDVQPVMIEDTPHGDDR